MDKPIEISEAQKKKAGLTIKGAAIGTMAGAAAGLAAGMLLAPKSGKETRKQIKQKAEAAKNKLTRRASHMKEKAKDRIEEAASKGKRLASAS